MQLDRMPQPTGTRVATARRSITLDGFRKYFDVEECITFVAGAVALSGWDRFDLPEYQGSLYAGLHHPLNEVALAAMVQYQHFDLDKLYERGRGSQGAGKTPAKPRIDFWVDVTSRGNLKAEWWPRDNGSDDDTLKDTDFLWFERSANRHRRSHDAHPPNELLFLYGFEGARSQLRYGPESPTGALNTPLLAACARAIERLKKRLDYHFDVRVCSDLFIEWGDPDGAGRDKLVGLELDDPQARQRVAELNELETLEERLGFSESALLKAKAIIAGGHNKAGDPLAPHTLSARLVRELKKQGLPATQGKVQRALELIERHRTRQA